MPSRSRAICSAHMLMARNGQDGTVACREAARGVQVSHNYATGPHAGPWRRAAGPGLACDPRA